MPEYDDTNTIVLFKNDQDGNENRPVLKGKVNIEGTEYEVALWSRTAKASGNKFWSGKVEQKDAQPVAAGTDEDVPF